MAHIVFRVDELTDNLASHACLQLFSFDITIASAHVVDNYNVAKQKRQHTTSWKLFLQDMPKTSGSKSFENNILYTNPKYLKPNILKHTQNIPFISCKLSGQVLAHIWLIQHAESPGVCQSRYIGRTRS